MKSLLPMNSIKLITMKEIFLELSKRTNLRSLRKLDLKNISLYKRCCFLNMLNSPFNSILVKICLKKLISKPLERKRLLSSKWKKGKSKLKMKVSTMNQDSMGNKFSKIEQLTWISEVYLECRTSNKTKILFWMKTFQVRKKISTILNKFLTSLLMMNSLIISVKFHQKWNQRRKGER